MAKIKYINLINDFWAADAVRHFDPVATRIYFEVLARLNANRWEPVAIPMRYWQTTVYSQSKYIYKVLAQLQDASLLRVVTQRAKATWYSVPEMEHETGEPLGYIVPHSVVNSTTAKAENPEILPQTVVNSTTAPPFNIIKDIDINNNNNAKTSEEKLIEEFRAADYDTARMAIAEAVGIPPQDIPRYFEDFCQHCRALGCDHADINGLRAHFYNWLKLHINGQNQRPSAAGYATSQSAGTKQPARTVEGVIAALAAKSDSSGFGAY